MRLTEALRISNHDHAMPMRVKLCVMESLDFGGARGTHRREERQIYEVKVRDPHDSHAAYIATILRGPCHTRLETTTPKHSQKQKQKQNK